MEHSMKDCHCRITNKALEVVLDLGMQPLGNGFISSKDKKDEYFYHLEVGFEAESKMLQLLRQPAPQLMFHENYAFFSSTSSFMQEHFKNFAGSVLRTPLLTADDPLVVELGCNDGILLKHFATRNIRHLGIEPSQNVALVANKNGVNTIEKFFDEDVSHDIVSQYGHADVFLAANVMCHIGSIVEVAKGIENLLKLEGVLIFEDPYLGDVIEKCSYDQIYDEHVFIFSALSVQNLFNSVGMEIINLERQSTHGGSMRYTLGKIGVHTPSPVVKKIIQDEKKLGLDKIETYFDFAKNVAASREQLVSKLKNYKREGKVVSAYGATSKSTTIYNYCDIGPDLISYVTDSTPIKQNTLTPGTHIPVVNPEKFYQDPPDVAFLSAWNHAYEILKKEAPFSDKGGIWLTHVPNVIEL